MYKLYLIDLIAIFTSAKEFYILNTGRVSFMMKTCEIKK